MEKITLDKCNGLKNVSKSGSNEEPIIEPGMYVVLSQLNVEIKVEVGPKFIGNDQEKFTGKVVNEVNATSPSLKIGEDIEFLRENICYITQK